MSKPLVVDVCPFCGRAPHQTQRIDLPVKYWKKNKRTRETEPRFRVMCNHCRALGPKTTTARGAVRAWNRRQGQ